MPIVAMITVSTCMMTDITLSTGLPTVGLMMATHLHMVLPTAGLMTGSALCPVRLIVTIVTATVSLLHLIDSLV